MSHAPPRALALAPALPIDDALPALARALAGHTRVVLQAPPGAGKTTRVPLALLDAPWLGDRVLVMLEPRRLAARAAARRMATTLGERPGETVGYRVRLETRVGPRTRVEVVTEGVLTRMLQEDPALERVGALVFDEFHERSLQADLGLALALETQAVLRDDLRLLVMSATLDTARVAALLSSADGAAAPVVTSEGRSFPVEVRWRAARPEARRGVTEAAVASTTRAALVAHDGDVLVFLPGVAEIRRVEEALHEGALPSGTVVRPLHGTLPPEAQDAAIAPSPPGERKVVLSTAIAETSLTIEGVRVVVDAGLARVPRFSPRTAMTHLDTVRVSRAGAEQRRGRAGRVAPGVCYRLWPEAEHHALPAHAAPEILEADLAPLALELAVAGVADPAALRWLDLPPAAAYAGARELLVKLGALDAAGRVTAHGRALAALPMHPRLAHMVLRAAALDAGVARRDRPATRVACALAALLAERDVLRGSPELPADADVRVRLDVVLGGGEVPPSVHGVPVDRGGVMRARQEARALGGRVPLVDASGTAAPPDMEAVPGLLLALAYPDRVAQRREGRPGRFLLRNGRGAAMDPSQPLGGEAYLAVADLAGAVGDRESRIALAAPIDAELLVAHFGDQVTREEETVWDAESRGVRARAIERLGALVLRERSLGRGDAERAAAVLLDAVRDAVRAGGIDALPWSASARRLRERVRFLRDAGVPAPDGAPWPDWDGDTLAASLDRWLAPHLAGASRWAALEALDLGAVLEGALSWPQRAALDALAPTHVTAPSGSRLPVDYADPQAPMLAVRLQELFGLAETPRVGGGRVPLVLHLLSPAHRPVQVTRDLANFWRTGYFDVRRDLRGRYPKHHWPDDPLAAAPTSRAKPRA